MLKYNTDAISVEPLLPQIIIKQTRRTPNTSELSESGVTENITWYIFFSSQISTIKKYIYFDVSIGWQEPDIK